MTEDVAREWVHRPNGYRRGRMPVDAPRMGRPDRVDGALKLIDADVYH